LADCVPEVRTVCAPKFGSSKSSAKVGVDVVPDKSKKRVLPPEIPLSP
jgi:hypothetical protein